MNNCINEYRVQCQSCRAEIGVRGIPPSRDNAAPRETTRPAGASEVFVIDDQHPCKAASMMDVYAPTPGADAKDVLEDSSWL
jgi:hypothetical protein